MKKHFAMLRRPLAMLLAVLMVLSAFNGAIVPASAAEANTAKLSELIDDEELAKLIASGYVFEDMTFSYAAPTNEDNLISVDETAGVITAVSFTDGYGNEWIPAAGQVMGDTTQNLAFTNGEAAFDAEQAGLNYTVEVQYQLQLNTADELEDLETIVSVTDAMIEDYTAMDELKSAASWLEFLVADIDKIASFNMEGNVLNALMDMTSDGWEIEIGEGYTLNVVLDDDTVYEAAKLLNDQTIDGTSLDLLDLLNGKSEMEVLAKDMDQMYDVLVDGIYYPVDEIVDGINATVRVDRQRINVLKYAIDVAVADLKAEAVAAAEAEMGGMTDEIKAKIEAEIDAAVEEYGIYTAVETVIFVFDDALTALEGPAARTEDEEWRNGEYADLIAAEADYLALNNMVGALAGGYTFEAVNPMQTEVYSTVEYRKASNKATIVAGGYYYNANGEKVELAEVYTDSFYFAQGTTTLDDLEQMVAERFAVFEAREAFIAEAGFEDPNEVYFNFDTVTKWSVDTDGAISEDVTYTVTFAPMSYKVTYVPLNGETVIGDYTYGSVYGTLPSAAAGKEYNYMIQTEKFLGYVEAKPLFGTVTTWATQGDVIRVEGETVITQIEGDASVTMDLSQLLGKDYTKASGNAAVTTDEGALLNTTALKDVSVTLRVPNNAQTLKDNGYITFNKEENAVEIRNYTASDEHEESGWVWTASSVKVSYNGETPAEVALTESDNGKKAVVDTLAFDQIFVTYELVLTDEALEAIGADDDMIQALRNAPAELISDYKIQKGQMDRLAGMDLSQVTEMTLKTILGGIVEDYGSEKEQAAYDEMMSHVKIIDGEVEMVTLVKQYRDDGDMSVYYDNYDRIASALESIKKNLPIILENENIKAGVNDLLKVEEGGKSPLDDISDKLNEIELTAPNAILDMNDPAFPALLDAIAAAASKGGSYVGGYANEELSLVSALEGIAGESKATVTVKMTWNDVTLTSDSKTYAIGDTLTGAEAFTAAQKAALEQKFQNTYADIAYYELVLTSEAVSDSDVIDGDVVVTYEWQPKEYTIDIPGSGLVTVKYTDTEITLPGTGDANYENHYEVPGNGTVKVGADAASVKIADFGALISGKITVTKVNVNEQAEAGKKAALVKLVEDMGNAALIEENGEYIIVLPVELSTDAADGLSGCFEALVFSEDFDDVLLDGEIFVDDGSAVPLHLQALVNAVMNSGLTSDDVMNTQKLVLADGQELLVKVDDLGELLVELPLTLKGETGVADAETTLYITLTGNTALWKENANLQKAQNYVNVVMDNDMAEVSVTLPERFPLYEAYLALMVVDNGVKFDDIDTVGNALALEYLIEDMVKPILSDEEITLDTYNNTLNKLESMANRVTDVNVPEIPGAVNVAGYTIDIANLYERFDSRAANVSVEYTDDGAKVDGYVPIEQVMSKLGISDVLSDMIAEKETGVFVTVNAKLTNTETKYDALFVAPNAEGLTNKIGLTENLAEEIGSIGAGAVIVLVDDVDGDLIINNTTVLDLNGNKVNGNIVANANVTILDTATETDGEVIGTVSGKLAIQGGKYSADVSEYLPTGYAQTNGVVNNVLYTITSNGNDVNINLNLSAENIKQFVNRQTLTEVKDLVQNPSVANLKEYLSDTPLTDLAIEMIADVALNYYGTAAFYLDGDKLYDVNLENAIGTLSGSDTVKNAVLTGLTWVDVKDPSGETGLSGIVNNIVAQLTDFQALYNAVSNGTAVVTAEVKTQPWDVQIARNADGDYLDLSVLSNDAEEATGTLTITATTNDQEVLDSLAVLAETTKVTKPLTLGITEADYSNKEVTLSGTYTGEVYIDANDIVLADDDDSNDKYIMTLAVILANADTENQQAWLDAMAKATEDKDYYDLKKLVDETTISELWTAVKKNTRGGTGIQEMAASLGISEDAIEARCALAVDVLAKVLRTFDIDGNSTKLGAFDPDDDGIYEWSKSYTAAVAPTVRGYTLNGELAFQNVKLSLELFPKHEHDLEKTEAVEATCTDDGNTEYWTCTICGKVFADEDATTETTVEDSTIAALGHDVSEEYAYDGTNHWYECSRCEYTEGKEAHIYEATKCDEAAECTVCDYVKPAGEHTPGAATVENQKAPTCTDGGSYDTVIYCTVCGEEVSRETTTVPAPGHTDGETVVENEVEATCTTDGSYDNVVYCTVCGEEVSRETVTVPATGHTDGETVTENEVEATCTTDGSYDEVVYCTVCGEEVSRETITVPAPGHAWNDWTEAKALTCTEEGVEVRSCSVCGETETRAIPASHTWGEWIVNKDATCTEPGEHHRFCTVCREYEVEEIPATGHTKGETVVENLVNVTCETDGSYENVIYCTVCGEELSRKTVILPATGHKNDVAVKENEIEATCTEEGSYDNVVYCAICGEELSREPVTVPATGHTKGDAVVENQVEVTCTEDGSYENVVYCSVCGEELSRKTVILPATGHKNDVAVKENEIEATCTEEGSYDNVVYCVICGEELEREPVSVPMIEHTKGETVVENLVNVTCESDGSYENVVYCTVCGEELSRKPVILPTNGHVGDVPVIENEVEATCEGEGSYDYVIYCSVCGEEISREVKPIEAKGHRMGNWFVTKPATCVDGGQMRRVCMDCGYYEVDDSIEALGHEYADVVVEPTCVTDGYTTHTCQRCGYTTTDTVVPANGHTMDDGVVTKPTCTEAGYTTYTCDVCGYSYTDNEAAALGHAWGKWTDDEDGTHSRVCGNDETHVETAEHTWTETGRTEPTETEKGEITYECECGATKTEEIPELGHVHKYTKTVTDPTCTEKGYTTYTCACGDEYQDDFVPANGHNNVYIPAQNATCTEDGHTGYVLCTVCGEHDEFETTVALGHSYGAWFEVEKATCEKAGTERHLCARCGAAEDRATEALGHKWNDGEVTKVPTETDNGEMTYTCENDPSHTKTETISALGHTHDYVAGETVKPTCSEQGYTVYTCACGDTIKADYVAATGHTGLVYVPAKEATCTEDGCTAGYKCLTCGENIEGMDVIEAHGHLYSIHNLSKAPTCKENGNLHKTCFYCGDGVDEVLPALGHVWGEWYEFSAADCEKNGVNRRECANCGAYETQTIPAKGHTEGETVIENEVSATCTKDGSYDEVVYCTVCDDEISRDHVVIPTPGHKAEACSKEYNCYVDGMAEHYYCAVCGGYFVKDSEGALVEIAKEDLADLVIAHHTCDGSADTCDALLAGLTDNVYPTWYHDHVDCMIDRGIMVGMTETTFEPGTGINRAMILVMLWRMAGEPASDYENVSAIFPDVTPDQWYAKAVMWAYESGVMKGVDVGSGKLEARPGELISRQQLITMIGRYVELIHYKEALPDAVVPGTMFSDVDEIADFAMKYFAWAIDVGLVNGMDDGSLSPNTISNRAQTAKLFHGLIELVLYPAESHATCASCTKG